MLKPEITQKAKLVPSLKTHQDVTAKPALLSVNHRSRTSVIVAGLALSMGISSFPVNCPGTVATAAESANKPVTFGRPAASAPAISAPVTADGYVQQLRSDVSAMRAANPVLIAQAQPTRYVRPTMANLGNNDSRPASGSEGSIQLAVPAPKTTTFKPVATILPAPIGNDSGMSSPGMSETTIGFAWPAAGKLTSRFGRRWGKMHKGIDIAGPVGTPINSAADGTVITSGWSSGGYGNVIEVRHADGSMTRYGHNSRLSVAVGQTVRQGQQIAEMGSTGQSTGSHLHFEIRPSGGNAVNPIAHLPANS